MNFLVLMNFLVSVSLHASTFKLVGETGSSKNLILEQLGNPTELEEFTAPNFQIRGIVPATCSVNSLQEIEVWAYKREGGFYQLIFKENDLVCLRWSSGPEPFSNIQL
ncbi:hypothetical protein CWB99_23855 [Pseudoalteromonas rubra]|uniref:Uncharacterized protein n=1 Tax=Pseudoalteromonas rubra TaxID=43658 RepID=A0A5S3WEI7_9GAMM|nr:hypothetical protein CWB99_23855 [Pseudoalteromonas rubra]TMP27485.1 hypothetical protein CWC00_23255 [Pseudoalteromonas rubra]